MVSLEQIRHAQTIIKGIAARTPLLAVQSQGDGDDRQLFLKLESFQPIGSFKLRGAYNKVASLPEDVRRRGVITYSSGNHAQGVAYAARAVGVKAVIVMPSNSPKVKVDATAELGAEIVMVGPASAERQAKAEELAAQHGYAMVPPYDDEKIIAGQGTAGLEILEDLPDVDVVLCPVSGGGLLSGIATALKLCKPGIKVIGVEPELAADSQQSLREGKLAVWPAEKTTRTIADGLRTQSLGNLNFEHVRKYVDDIVTVSEQEIRDSIREILTRARIIAEPSGAVSYAGFRFHESELPKGSKYVAVVSGGNIDPKLLIEVLSAQ